MTGRSHHAIDYRHVIGSLVQKPGALARYRYREALFPTPGLSPGLCRPASGPSWHRRGMPPTCGCCTWRPRPRKRKFRPPWSGCWKPGRCPTRTGCASRVRPAHRPCPSWRSPPSSWRVTTPCWES
ncbi:MAG: hypothetical protein MZV64_71475 [Ignavibacteriales bacterium]|nr:hypothetical protein [Ignavibacteriales bacterium]